MPYDHDFVPSTIEEAVDHLVSQRDEREENFIKKQPPEAAHFGGGMEMRNGWSLWEKETPIKRDAIQTYGIAMADDLSGLILAWVRAKVQGKEFDPHKHVERYKEHWKAFGTTALEAGGYNEDGTPKPD